MMNLYREAAEPIITSLGIEKDAIDASQLVDNLVEVLKPSGKRGAINPTWQQSLGQGAEYSGSVLDAFGMVLQQNTLMASRLAEALSSVDNLEEKFGYVRTAHGKAPRNRPFRHTFWYSIVENIGQVSEPLVNRRTSKIMYGTLSPEMPGFFNILEYCTRYNKEMFSPGEMELSYDEHGELKLENPGQLDLARLELAQYEQCAINTDQLVPYIEAVMHVDPKKAVELLVVHMTPATVHRFFPLLLDLPADAKKIAMQGLRTLLTDEEKFLLFGTR